MEPAHRSSPSARLLPRGVPVLRLAAGPRELALLAGPDAGFARYPPCGSHSERVRSRYVRTVSDLPWRGKR